MIPEAAVEAAARRMALDDGSVINWVEYKAWAGAILEAAAPHLMAQVLTDAVDAFPLETITAPDDAVVWLTRPRRTNQEPAVTITEFLEARIAQDSRAIEVAREYATKQMFGNPSSSAIVISDSDGARLWSTDQIPAECAAKRAIIATVVGWRHDYNDDDMWYSCPLAVGADEAGKGSGYSGEDYAVCRCGLEARQLAILSTLAAIYADHPDYQQEWAPRG